MLRFAAPQIEKGVPIPKQRKKRKRRVYPPSPWIAFLKSMVPGDSFRTDYFSGNAAVAHMRRLKIPYQRQAVNERPLSVRVWRTG